VNIVEKRERIAGIRTLNMYCRLAKNSKTRWHKAHAFLKVGPLHLY